MSAHRLTGMDLLLAMDGIPDEILERSETAGWEMSEGADTSAAGPADGSADRRRPMGLRGWRVISGRVAAAAAAILIVAAGARFLTPRIGSSAPGSSAQTEEASEDYEENIEEAFEEVIVTGGGQPLAAGPSEDKGTAPEAVEEEMAAAEEPADEEPAEAEAAAAGAEAPVEAAMAAADTNEVRMADSGADGADPAARAAGRIAEIGQQVFSKIVRQAE